MLRWRLRWWVERIAYQIDAMAQILEESHHQVWITRLETKQE
jgi:hypothetical protein